MQQLPAVARREKAEHKEIPETRSIREQIQQNFESQNLRYHQILHNNLRESHAEYSAPREQELP